MKKSISNEREFATYDSGSESIEMIDSNTAVLFATVASKSSEVYSDDVGMTLAPVPGVKDEMYVMWGPDNQTPYNVIESIESDEVMSENKLFNVKACFGQGIRFFDRETNMSTTDDEVIDFFEDNAYNELFAAQIYDMMYFCFSLDVIILNADCSRIVSIVHKAAENVRFKQANEMGVVTKAYYANWRENAGPLLKVESIELLDVRAPWKDLDVRLGNAYGADMKRTQRTKNRVFGILTMMPIPGSRYYPVPPYAAVYKGGWLEIKKLIQINIKATLKNTFSVRYHVEIHRNYWKNLFAEKGVSGDKAKQEALTKEKRTEIRNFLSNMDNKGKTWISEYYVNPQGTEERMIRINTIDTGKRGGEWSDDIAEACNMICYADEIHPNLVGAVPGKTQTNNSGSDKRELFTMKQSMMTLPQKLLMKPHVTMLRFNGKWKNVGVDVPMITLTTLDTHKDAEKVITNPNA